MYVCMGWREQCAPVTVQAGVTTREVSVCVGGGVCVDGVCTCESKS